MGLFRSDEAAKPNNTLSNFLWLDGSKYNRKNQSFLAWGSRSKKARCACVDPKGNSKATIQSRGCDKTAYALCQQRKCLVLYFSLYWMQVRCS